ncbi:MAG: 2-phospho-L-lactate guanylyltransferase [Acidimicrobiia bacterium]
MRNSRYNTAILVPVKPLAVAKSRLAPAVPPEEREKLALSLASRVLAVAVQTGVGVFVVTSDPTVAEAALDLSASVVSDPGICIRLGQGSPRALNTALEVGAAAVYKNGYESALIVPSDLPYVCVADLLAAMRRPGEDGIVIAPSIEGGGTNALTLRLPPPIPFSFGPDSFHRHLSAAFERGLPVRVLRRKGLSFDLDTPSQIYECVQIRSCTGG